MQHTFLTSRTILPSVINICSMALELWQSHGFHWQILSGEWTQKLQHSKLQFSYTTNLLTSCSILPSIINIFQRLLELQGFYCQILTGEIPEKLQYLELSILYKTRLPNVLYNSPKCHRYIWKGVEVNQTSTDSKPYLVSKLRPPCP